MDLLLMTSDPNPAGVLPAVGLLAHRVRTAAPTLSALTEAVDVDIALVDARGDLAAARGLCRSVVTSGSRVPVVGVLTEGGLVAVGADWGLADFLLSTTVPAEVEARLRLVVSRQMSTTGGAHSDKITLGDLVIDETTYTARLRGRPLDLTYKEFELLKYLTQHPGRVFSREQLLHEVWGYDFFGGTRTVDVHVRRLRAKLGSEHEALIGTVRGVGYKAVRPGQGISTGDDQTTTRNADVEHAAFEEGI